MPVDPGHVGFVFVDSNVVAKKDLMTDEVAGRAMKLLWTVPPTVIANMLVVALNQ